VAVFCLFVQTLQLLNVARTTTTSMPDPVQDRAVEDSNVPSPPALIDTTNTCQAEKLNFPYRTLLAEQSPKYKMFVYGPGKDTIVSDSIFNSNGRDSFEKHIQVHMEKQLKGQVPKDTVVLDIGANIGLHGLYLASKGFLVHAFEPGADSFQFLKCSKLANQFDNMVVNNFGLSSEDAELCHNINPTNRGASDVSPGDCPDAEKVVVKKLDDYFDTVLNGTSPYMIKIDIEGYEIHALTGGEKMFKQDPPKLVFAEVSPNGYLKLGQDVTQFYDFFWSYDYTVYRIKGPTLKKIERGGAFERTGQSDVLMVHSSIDLVA
jgi:FkbM family methyltransferase